MGNKASSASSSGVGAASGSRTSTSEEPAVTLAPIRSKPLKEKSRHGVVNVTVMTQTAATRARLPRNDLPQTHVITSRGSIIHGSQSDPSMIQRALSSYERPLLEPSEIAVPDSRAHEMLVTHSDGWYAIPAPEVFSRNSGTCLILGDRTHSSQPYSMKLGDCFRLGSVGLVVTEIKLTNQDLQRLDSSYVQHLKDECLAFDNADDMAALAMDENDTLQDNSSMFEGGMGSPSEAVTEKTDGSESPTYGKGLGLTMGERFICYMCYETHDTADDPLVAPCDCRGDTRYLHVQCLQKWYQTSMNSHRAQVIRITGTGAPACKICGGAYKTTFKKADGTKASLLEFDNKGPYLSVVVVTRHDTNPGLFNTKFRLNFGRNTHGHSEEPEPIIVGRSSSCNMVLDYRTVSTVHAKVFYHAGAFFLQDRRSSNGTMVYLRDPVPLSFSESSRFRMGRSTVTLQAKRNWFASLRHTVAKLGSYKDSNAANNNSPTPQQYVTLLAACAANEAAKPHKKKNREHRDAAGASGGVLTTLSDEGLSPSSRDGCDSVENDILHDQGSPSFRRDRDMHRIDSVAGTAYWEDYQEGAEYQQDDSQWGQSIREGQYDSDEELGRSVSFCRAPSTGDLDGKEGTGKGKSPMSGSGKGSGSGKTFATGSGPGDDGNQGSSSPRSVCLEDTIMHVPTEASGSRRGEPEQNELISTTLPAAGIFSTPSKRGNSPNQGGRESPR